MSCDDRRPGAAAGLKARLHASALSYVIRAGRIDPEELAAAGIVRAYKQLKEAEKGFGGLKARWRSAPSTTASRIASAHTC